MFYLPIAAFLGAFATVAVPRAEDRRHVRRRRRGDAHQLRSVRHRTGHDRITVGDNEVYIDPQRVAFEEGTAARRAFKSLDEIQVGTRRRSRRSRERWQSLDGRASARRTTARRVARREADCGRSFLLFPLTAALIAFGLLFAEGLTTRNWVRMIERTLLGSFLAALFAALAFIPAG